MTERQFMPTASRRVKPTGLVRRLLHVPDLLYRWHLGWLLGHRFLLLTHRGRKSGLVRRTVLEVVYYDPATRESVVLSGLGATADWYRNIEAQPATMVQTGRRRYPPRHRLLAPAEAAAVAAEFARRHPLEARVAVRVLGRLGWSAGDEHPTWPALAAEIPMVAFRPRD
ncbi:MAG TPA: nitroreductase family deazaflavin-dependent oxidoreductase [Thermomicrobiales bacterium]|nr:nitroreductase family deazaflavin-dependent oxidoreductase [Thermomicrobiales bacterium]